MAIKPKYSIVIPAFNEANYLERCLLSIQHQQYAPSYEIIVVDNASTDNTAAIAKKLGAKVVLEPKQGVPYAREAGRIAARGTYIVSTDADSFFKPNWLKSINDFYEAHPDAVGIAGHYSFYKGPLWSKIFPSMGAVLVWIISLFTHRAIYASAANLSFKRTAFSGYDTRFYQGGDERGVINELQRSGRVYVSLKNPVYTSSRRMYQGFWYSILITIGYYYTYNAWNTKKRGTSKIGALPAIRSESRRQHLPLLLLQWAVSIVFVIGVVWLVRIWA